MLLLMLINLVHDTNDSAVFKKPHFPILSQIEFQGYALPSFLVHHDVPSWETSAFSIIHQFSSSF